MSKPQSNKAENNIGLIAGGLIGLGYLNALGVGLITLPVAIGIGVVVTGGFGAKELMNMKGEKETKKVDEKRRPSNKAQIEEGKTIGREIAEEYITNPQATIEDSLVVKQYKKLYEEEKNKDPNSQKTIDAKFKLNVAYVAKKIVKDFHEKKEFAHDLLRVYKSNPEFSKIIIAESAFDEVANFITAHQQRSSPAPQSQISGWDKNVKERG